MPQKALNTPSGLGQTRCEKLCLDFFYHVSAPSYVNFGSHYFWNSLVIQACYQEDAIRHLILASTSLDLRERKQMSAAKAELGFAMHYGRALELLASATDPGEEIMLMACLLFILCSELNNDPAGVRRHLTAGRRILRGLAGRKSAYLNDSLQEVAPIFKRLEFTSGPANVPIVIDGQICPKMSSEWTERANKGINSVFERHSIFQGFSTLAIAAHCLQSLAPPCFAPAPDGSHLPKSTFHVVPVATAQLHQWIIYLHALVARMTPEERLERSHDIANLTAMQMCLSIMSRCAPYLNEGAYDQFDAQFEMAREQLAFVLDDDVPETIRERAVCPLYFIAAHCRSPKTRRMAVEYLKLCGWPGIRMAALAQQIVNLEERTDWTGCSAQVPVDRRLNVLDVAFTSRRQDRTGSPPAEGSCCVISYAKTPFDGSNNDVLIYRWSDLPADDVLQASVQQLIRRVTRFELVALREPLCEDSAALEEDLILL